MDGIDVLINSLYDDRSRARYQAAIGKKIAECRVDDDAVHLVFEDGSKLCIFDNGQSCCESRWMSTDDDPKDLVGSRLVRVEVADAELPGPESADVYEAQFLRIIGDQWTLTCVTHVDHNGYYGGFSIAVREE